MLNELKKLAEQSSSEKRRLLLEEMTALFTEDSKQHSDPELILFKDVFLKLLDEVDTDAKVQFSEKMALIDQTPREIAVKLAQHPIEIAKPILEHSSSLNESDLLDIAKTKSMEYRLAITKRTDITAAVSDEIISHREHIVIESICKNPESLITESGFEIVVELAESNPDIKKHLPDRLDIPTKMINQVWALLEPSDKEKFQSLVNARGDLFSDQFFDSVSTKSMTYIEEINKERKKTVYLVSKMKGGENTPAKLIKEFCDKKNPNGVAIVLSELTTIPEDTIFSALLNENGKAISILCKSLGISTETFQAIISLRQAHLGADLEGQDSLLNYFNDMEIDAARRSIRYLKVKLQSAV